ncbi:major facilitator superfamily domain-containing protein, partial [Xylariaceae sp. FL0804]
MQLFIMTASNAVMGWLFDRYGPKWLLRAGTLVYVFGLCMLSLSTAYWQIMLTQGLVAPLGASAVFNCAVNSTLGWFLRRRAMAVGMVVSGSSLGGVVLPIFLQHLFPRIGFPWTIRALALIVLALCSVSCVTIRSRLPPRPTPFRVMDYVRPLGDRRMLLVIGGSFFAWWGLFVPFSYLPLQAKAAGTDPTLVPYIIPILNACSIPGRVVPGAVADRIGKFNTTIFIAGLSGIITLALWVPGRSTAAIFTYGAVFGFGSGGFISLLPATVAQISDLREIGVRTGVVFFFGAVGALTGSPLGGAIVAAQGGSYLGLQLFCGLVLVIGMA